MINLSKVIWFSKKNVARRAKEKQEQMAKFKIPDSVIFIGDIWIELNVSEWINNLSHQTQKIIITNVSKAHSNVMYDGIFSENSDTTSIGTEVQDSANNFRENYVLFSSPVRNRWDNYLGREFAIKWNLRLGKNFNHAECARPPLAQWNPDICGYQPIALPHGSKAGTPPKEP